MVFFLARKTVRCVLYYVFVFLLAALNVPAPAQTISFSSGNLAGENINNPTSLDFGPDGRLYVSQQDGTIFAYTIVRNGPGNYQVTSTEAISIIRSIPNHNDNGALNLGDTRRQVTGILATGTSANPVLYVSSSDPRIGGGGTAGDLNLDTNSGIISKLTWNGTSWTKVDVVIGLPRSEENHASNGMVIDPATNTLYLAQGGHTNAGAPSNNFAFLTEYALAAAIVKIDLNRIETEFNGSYVLPTLDDPDPARNTGTPGVDLNDPFGGNDGRNQAKLVPGGPVQIHSPGYRNIYDLVLTRAIGKSGRMYTIDNGANGNWGGHPDQEGAFGNPLQTLVTNKYNPAEPGSNGPGPNDAKVNNLDNLHYVSGPGFPPIYGGHPNPIRANPANAGLHYYNNATSTHTYQLQPTVDWPPVDVSMANPVEGDFRNPGVNDGALHTWAASTNGLAEYTSLAYFGGAMYGNLLAASFDGNIYRIVLSADGTQATSVTPLFSGFGTSPLDVIAQGDDDIFPGTIWAVTYGSDNITVFEPVGPAQETWLNQPYAGGTSPAQRHENGFVQVGGKFYLIGGRGIKPVGIFDPITKTWTAGASPPLQLHHFQAVAYDDKIYIIGAMTGNYPSEQPVDRIYIYDPSANAWSEGDMIPAARRRGSAGVVLYKNKFYIGGGITNGHIDGWSVLLDSYDPETDTWTPLPNLPEARDHFHAAIINGKIYFAGGRRTGASGVFGATVQNVDVYDIENGNWSTVTQIPTPRGAPAVATFNGQLLIAGGEVGGNSQALNVVEVYDPVSNAWITKPPMNIGRHGTQMIIYGNTLYIAAGSSTQGDTGENNTMSYAIYDINCTGAYDAQVDDDLDGYSNADEIDNGTDPCSAGSKPHDYDNDLVSDLNDDDDDNDGLADTVDLFALDPSNGQDTFLPIDYPFLNGEPGFGFFGVGHTGLMTNKNDDYASLFDPEHPDLIVGGAVGVLSAPAESGDARSNTQRYAFQFGVNLGEAPQPFTIRTRLLGSPYFGGVELQDLQDQSQGIFIGTGDQDNYFRISLFANFGNPGIQLLREEDGFVILNDVIPVPNVLNSEALDLLIDVNPETGELAFRYQRNSDPLPIPVGASSYIASGNLLNSLQNAPALAVGVIASSGEGPSYSASWDLIRITHPGPYIIDPYPDQQVFIGQPELIVPMELIFGIDGGIGSLSFEVSGNSNPQLISDITVDGTDLILGLNAILGETDLTLRATDPDNRFAESTFKLSILPEITEIAHINAGGPGFEFNNTVWQSDQYFGGGSQYSRVVAINNTLNDVLYQTERYGNFTYSIPVPVAGTYYIDFHFAEIYHGIANNGGVGSRVFNVAVENNQFNLQNFDIFQQTGAAATALIVRADNIQVTDGVLNIAFSTVTDNAKVSGISVYRSTSGGPSINEPPFVITPYPNQQIPISQSSLSVPLDEIFDDDDGFEALNVEVTNISNPALIASAEINGAQLLIGLNPVPGITNIALKATDATLGFAETVVQIEILAATQHGLPVVHINAGGAGVQTGGHSWIADQYFSGGSTSRTTSAISNTEDDIIFQSERFGNVTYHIPVPQNGLYSVDLHLAEIYWTNVNQRIFNISVENGQYVKQGIDLIQEYGPRYTAVVLRAEPISVSDGFLDITMTTVKDNAKMSGIAVYHYSLENLPPVIVPVANVTIVEGQFWSYQVEAMDPNPGDVIEYSATNLPASLEITPSTGLISGTIEASADVFTVTLRATDAEGKFDEKDFTITVRENNPPAIITPPNAFIEQGEFFSYQLQASDSDAGDAITYSSTGLPANLVLAPQSGVISGTASDVAGPYAVTVRATDPWGAFAEASFQIEVIYVNQPPAASVTVDASYCQDSFMSIAIQASDPEDGELVFSIDPSGDPLPDDLSLDPATGLISGVLAQTGTSSTYNIVVRVTDPEDASTTVPVTINSDDCTTGLRIVSLILINSITDVEVMALSNGQQIHIDDLPPSINIKANVSEPAGSVVFGWQGNPNFRVEGVAPYALAGDNNGNYSNLTIGPGTYTVTATPFTGGGASGTQGIPMSVTFYVTEEQVNVPPSLLTPPDVFLKVNQSWSYQVQASDAGGALSYTAINLPSSLTINPSTGLISGTVTASPAEFNVTVTVEDVEELTTSASFKIHVTENRPPVISIPALPEFCRGTFVTISPVASDPDGDPLVFALASASGPLPPGLSLNTATGVISGVLATAGGEGQSTPYNIIVEVSDSDGATAQDNATIISNNCGSGMQVTSLVLINSANEIEIVTLYDGIILNAATLPQQMNIKANVSPAIVGSVRFGFQGNANYRMENTAPYALGGDNSGNYNHMTFSVGTYTVTATPYQNGNGAGTVGIPLTITFTIQPPGEAGLRIAATPPVESVEEGDKGDEYVNLFPNPAQREFFVRITAPQTDTYYITMVNPIGKEISMGTYLLQRGEHLLRFDLNPMLYAPGVYYLSVTQRERKVALKLVIR